MKLIRWLLLFAFFICAGGAHAEEILKLLPRSQEMVADPGLTQSEWRWVREHRKIRMAVWLPMSPPYDITTGLNDYGGINADFVGLIAENLGLDIEIVRYAQYADALAALRTGEADFIAQASDNQRQDGLLLSIPYSPDNAVEVLNTDMMKGNPVRKIASAFSYDRSQVLARYPGAEAVTFSSSRHALEALAFRQIDLFFCDEITARYLVSQSNLSNLRIRPLSTSFPTSGFSFAAMPDHHIWISVLNKLLRALPESTGVEIYRRWNGGIPLSLSEQRPIYTSLERKWIQDHAHIRVAVAEDNAPVAWFTASGQLHGIIADILTALHLRTGFNFEIQRYPTQRAALEAVKKGNADLVAGGVQDDIWREELITTRTWLYNSWVMVGREHHPRTKFNSIVVSLDGQSPEPWLRQQDRELNEKADTWRQGLARVARGESDMMAMPLIVANVQLASKEFAGLRILASLDIEPMRYSFGASRRAWPLITILNKALINIPPEDLHALTRGRSADNSFMAVAAKSGSASRAIAIVCVTSLMLLLAFIALRLHRRRMQLQLEAIPFPIFISDEQGRIRMANQRVCDSLSASQKEMVGAPLGRWFGGSDPFGEPSSAIVHLGERMLRPWRAPLPNGRGFIGGWTEVSREYQFVARLRQLKRHADGENRAKSTFLTTMSHEIRTPLSAIIGILELMMKRPDDGQKNPQFIQMAWDAAQSLLLLIGNILDVSRIESGRLVLRPERVSLRGLIEETAVMFEGIAAQKGLAFALEIDADIQDDVLADRSRLRQIIVNLTGNAVKYTDSGQVALHVHVEGRDKEYLRLCIEVEDTGPGIDDATRARLFHPFVQGNDGNIAQGSGLGLYICRSLAQMMGGSVDLQSEPGTGTRVVVMLQLPLMAPLKVAAARPPQQKPQGVLNVLVVDDNPVGRMMLIEQLQWLGHSASGAESGTQALSALERALPDAVITDCNMPDMNGFGLVKTLRERYPALAVFGVTADARETVRKAALEAGMRDCLFKPITLKILSELLASLSAPSAASGTTLWPEDSELPAALLEGENLIVFLTLQIDVIDETLQQLAQWRGNPDIALRDTLHKLRGGIQLLGATGLQALCETQERMPDEAGITHLETELTRLRAELQRWRDTGLQPENARPTR